MYEIQMSYVKIIVSGCIAFLWSMILINYLCSKVEKTMGVTILIVLALMGWLIIFANLFYKIL